MTAYGGNEINAYGELNLKHLTQFVPGFNFWLDRGNQWLIIYSLSGLTDRRNIMQLASLPSQPF